jgi:DNA-binding Xre family transcriptional regulator
LIVLTIGVHLLLRFKLKERVADLAFRERRRVTLQEIADSTGLNRMTLSKLVNLHGANVQTDVVDKLCNYFGCRVEELVEHIPDNTTDQSGVPT